MGIRISAKAPSLVSLLLFLFFFLMPICHSIDIIEPKNTIKDGEKMFSANNVFALGFFSPPNSTNRYMGVWYNKIKEQIKAVWVANRENPLRDFSGVLEIDLHGNLVILDRSRSPVWSTNITSLTNISRAQLSDAGNLILREVGPNNSTLGRVLWESFKHPTDTVLPTMKVGLNTKTNEKNPLTSWRTASDPSIGTFSVGVDPQKFPQGVIWNGSVPYWRSGPWNGQRFLGIPEMENIYVNGVSVNRDIQDGTIDVSFQNSSSDSMYVLDPLGVYREWIWDEKGEKWMNNWSAPDNKCDFYGACGPFGTCNKWVSPICKCLRGFEPKQAEEWNKGNWSGGCVRRNQWQCEKRRNGSSEVGKKDGFWRIDRVKLPDLIADSSVASNVRECEEECLRDCSCGAYAYDEGGIGCVFWNGDLVDIQEFTVSGAQLHIRLASSELETKSQTSMIISVTVIASVLLLGMVVYCVWRKMIKKKGYTRFSGSFNETFGEDGRKEIDVPFFEFDCILDATEQFTDSNKLGRGGFGPVYKGKLPNGQEIAVKRLSKSSGQGQVEFKNEVLLIAKLQHKNLVRLLGYCIEGDERILLYEYMPNKSLDFHLFDPNRSMLLSWEKRHNMILGIARGLLYLHEDSRLTVIHRDLKTSNVLLDEEMKPKISDFGMARIFGANQIQENTNRIVGTYGYMSPEYASHGLFSVKSDVFSFGVILLEIVSGTKNTLFYHSEQSLSLVGHAWKLWTEGKWMDLMDRNLDGTTDTSEVEKCVHIGLLCVQENTADRPTMSSVVAMLVSETSIPVPKPAAFLSRSFIYSDSPNCSNNEVTISTLECR